MTMMVVTGKPEKVNNNNNNTVNRVKPNVKPCSDQTSKSPLRSSRFATNLAKSRLFKAKMLYNTMLQKLNELKMARIRRDVASGMAICISNIKTHFKKHSVSASQPTRQSRPRPANLNRSKRLHGEQLGGPQLKVEAEAVEESPDEHRLTGSQPQDGDAEGAQRRHQLLHHVLVSSSQVVVHIPVDNESASEPRNASKNRYDFEINVLISLAQPLVDPSVKMTVKDNNNNWIF